LDPKLSRIHPEQNPLIFLDLTLLNPDLAGLLKDDSIDTWEKHLVFILLVSLSSEGPELVE